MCCLLFCFSPPPPHHPPPRSTFFSSLPGSWCCYCYFYYAILICCCVLYVCLSSQQLFRLSIDCFLRSGMEKFIKAKKKKDESEASWIRFENLKTLLWAIWAKFLSSFEASRSGFLVCALFLFARATKIRVENWKFVVDSWQAIRRSSYRLLQSFRPLSSIEWNPPDSSWGIQLRVISSQFRWLYEPSTRHFPALNFRYCCSVL